MYQRTVIVILQASDVNCSFRRIVCFIRWIVWEKLALLELNEYKTGGGTKQSEQALVFHSTNIMGMNDFPIFSSLYRI